MYWFFRLLEWAAIGAALLFVITQLFLPLVRGRPAFPMFRRGPQIERELQTAREEADDRELERTLRETRKKK